MGRTSSYFEILNMIVVFSFFSFLVEADVGIIVGTSKSLLAECERSGVEVVDLIVKS
jgi:hypothetical protein